MFTTLKTEHAKVTPTWLTRIPQLVFELSAICFAVVAALWGAPYLGLVPLGCIGAFYFYARQKMDENPEIVTGLADQIYVTGYLCTLIGLGAVAYKVGSDKEFASDPLKTFRLGGLALSSTALSLFLMNRLKARLQSSGPSLEDIFKKTFSELLTRLETADSQRSQAFIDALSKSGFSRALEATATEIRSNAEGLAKLKHISEQTHEFLLQLNSELKEMHSHLKKLGALTDKHAPSIKIAAESSNDIEAMSQRLKGLSDRAGETELSFRGLASEAAVLNGNVKALSNLPGINADLFKIASALSNVTHAVEVHGSTLASVQTNAQGLPALLSQLSSMVETLKNLETRIEATSGRTEEFSVAMGEIKTVIDDCVHVISLKLDREK